jgi:hypothetical protein
MFLPLSHENTHHANAMLWRRDNREVREEATVSAWMHDVVDRIEAADALAQQPIDLRERPKRVRPLRANRARR